MRDFLKRNSILLVSSIFLFVSLSLVLVINYDKKKANTKDNEEIAGASDTNVESKIKIEVNNGSDTKSYETKYEDNLTAYDYLNRLADEDEDNFNIIFSEFEFDGKTSYFVSTINDFTPDSSSQFWKFQVNGVDAQVGISDYEVSENDTLSFVVDNITF